MREVRSLIGMGSYYRRFIPNFYEIAEPVIALTRKYARFKWTDECQSAFEYLKQSLTVVPLLAYPDPNKPYTLYTDASNYCIGLFVCFVALRPMSTAMVIAGRSVHLTTLIPGQA